jgi:hypothetical protein
MARKFLDKIYNVEPAFKAINKRVHVPNLGQGASGQGQDLALFKVRCVIFYFMCVCSVCVSVRLLFVFLCNELKCMFQCVCACVCFCVYVRLHAHVSVLCDELTCMFLCMCVGMLAHLCVAYLCVSGGAPQVGD